MAGERFGAPIVKYRTREEKREAGLQREITDWLTFSGVVESEIYTQVLTYKPDNVTEHRDGVDPALQFNFEVSFLDLSESDIILEYTEDSEDPVMEELLVAWDWGNWGITTGRYYIPFGEYFSNFINGPLLEFSQTRADVLQVDYDFNDIAELAMYTFEGRSTPLKGSSIRHNWGASFETTLFDDHVQFGLGYLNNVADGDFRPLEDESDIYTRAVSAWNVYMIAEWERFGFAFEQTATTRPFLELDAMEDKPKAWNVESVYYPGYGMEIGLRYEKASEISDEPAKQYGIQFTWRPLNRLSFTVELLKSEYLDTFDLDEEERAATNGYIGAGSFSFIF